MATGSARSIRTALKGDRSAISRSGFGSMDPLRQRAIASQGGKAAHQKGTAHKWTSEEAREAGRIGGRRTALVVAARSQMEAPTMPLVAERSADESA